MPDLRTLSSSPHAHAPSLAERLASAARSPQRVVVIHAQRGAPLERFARELHDGSARSRGEFVLVDAGEPQSEGLSRSACERARRGTLVLARLERATASDQRKWSQRIARWKREHAGAPRVVALFHSDPRRLAERDELAFELLEALDGLSVRVEPLCERRGDIAALARAHVEKYSEENGRATNGAAAEHWTPDALAELERLPWPGGERELELWIERALLLAGDGPIEREHVAPPRSDVLAPSHADGDEAQEHAHEHDDPGRSVLLPAGDRSLAAVEAALIRRVMAEQSGNVSRCAEVLGIHRSTLHAKLRALRRG